MTLDRGGQKNLGWEKPQVSSYKLEESAHTNTLDLQAKSAVRWRRFCDRKQKAEVGYHPLSTATFIKPGVNNVLCLSERTTYKDTKYFKNDIFA